MKPKTWTISDFAPWAGLIWWIGLWLWLMFSNPAKPSPSDSSPVISRVAAQIELSGFNVRYMTRYSDQKSTWMDLYADKGRNMKNLKNTHLLHGVVAKVVIADRSKQQPEGGIAEISEQLDLAWFLIRSETGIYSFDTDNIELSGNVEVFGYTKDGELAEWIGADKLIFDQENQKVWSVGPAQYDGLSGFRFKPCSGILEAGLDLSNMVVTEFRSLDPRTFQSPIRNPELRPPYSPPEALKIVYPATSELAL